jgi:hypothetical protein
MRFIFARAAYRCMYVAMSSLLLPGSTRRKIDSTTVACLLCISRFVSLVVDVMQVIVVFVVNVVIALARIDTSQNRLDDSSLFVTNTKVVLIVDVTPALSHFLPFSLIKRRILTCTTQQNKHVSKCCHISCHSSCQTTNTHVHYITHTKQTCKP